MNRRVVSHRNCDHKCFSISVSLLSVYGGVILLVVGCAGSAPSTQKAADSDTSRIASVMTDVRRGKSGLHPALENVAKLGDEDKHAIAKALLKELNDQSDVDIRQNAAMILQAAKPDQPDVLPFIVDALDVERDEICLQCLAGSLCKYGAAAKDAVPPLLKALSSQNSWTRQSVLSAIGHTGTDDPEALRCLTNALADSDRWCRIKAIVAIRQLGHAKRAENEIKKLLKDPDPFVRQNAEFTLDSMKKED